jgi:S-(hydroxymethyl)glutathione dehydrogenase/alcohol dehydrogenase
MCAGVRSPFGISLVIHTIHHREQCVSSLFRSGCTDAGALCLLSTFAPYGTVLESSLVEIDDDIPLDGACLVGGGVTTGWGSADNSAALSPGDTVVVIGCGRIGSGAIQGARIVGAENIVVVDTVEG